jgi:hypothetical protein
MSVNTSHTPDGRGVLLYQGEIILLFSQNVNVELEANPNPVFYDKKYHGYIYLTSHRVIFINTKSGGNLRSFSMPFFCMRNVKLEQPVFGANYMKGTAIAQPNGNYQGDLVWKITFPKGGCIHFGQALLRANDTAGQFVRYDVPPPYEAPSAGYREMPPSYYYQGNYQGYNYTGNVFTDVPTNVYVYDQPPPYPGIDGFNNQPQQNGPPGNPPYPAGENPPYPAGANPPYPAGNAPPYPTGNTLSNPNGMYPPLHQSPSAPPSEPPPAYEAPPLPPKA